MSYEVIKHNRRVRQKNWWRRYFWSQNEYWAKFAVSRAGHKAKVAKLEGKGTYYFWSQVSLRAAAFCARNFGPVPKLLTKRPIKRNVSALYSPEVTQWLNIPPPYRSRKKGQLCQ